MAKQLSVAMISSKIRVILRSYDLKQVELGSEAFWSIVEDIRKKNPQHAQNLTRLGNLLHLRTFQETHAKNPASTLKFRLH